MTSLLLYGAPEVDVEVLLGPPGLEFPRACHAGACWQLFANGTFLYTPGAEAGARDDLFPVQGAYSRAGDRLELHATRRAETGANVSIVGFLQGLPDEPRLLTLKVTSSGTNTQIVRVSQALGNRPEADCGQEWPPVPSAFAVTLRGRVGTEPLGPLEGLLHLRTSTEGDPNPLVLQVQSRDLNQQGSLYWTSFLAASEPKVRFCSVSVRPAEKEILAQRLPGNLSNPLAPYWVCLRKLPEAGGLEISDWIPAEQGEIRLRLEGSRVRGEISAQGRGLAYEAAIEGSLQAVERTTQPPPHVNPYAGEISFEGSWHFPRLGPLRLQQKEAEVHGTGLAIELSGNADGNVLPLSWTEKGGGKGTGFLIAVSDRHRLAALLLDAETGRWRAEVGERRIEPAPVHQEPEPASRQDLKYRGYDLVMEGRSLEAIELLEQARALYRQDRDRTDLWEIARDNSLIDEINILTRLSACYLSLGRFDGLLAGLREYVAITRLLVSRSYLAQIAGAPGIENNLSGPLETYRDRLTGDLDKIQAQDASRSFFEELVDLLLELGHETEALLASEKARARAFADLLADRSPMRRLPEGQVVSAGATLPVTDATLKAAVERSQSTVVEYMVTDQRLIVWVISPQGAIKVETVAVTQQALDELVQELVLLLGGYPSPAARRNPRERQRELLRRLHSLLIDPIASHLPPQPEARVTFVPQGALFQVPFPALLDSGDQPLIARFTLATTPAIGVLASLSPPVVLPWEAREVLVVGNPTPPRGHEPLEGAEKEAQAVACRFGASPLVGRAATREAVVAALPGARLIHLACHGLLEHGEEQSFPGALVLASEDDDDRGFLTSREIAGLSLRADLVVLSACKSGLGRITGDGVVGLSRSFLTAGARGVVVSLWSIDDESTAFLMDELYSHIAQEGDRAQALRKAMLAARGRHDDPESWAAFTFMGLEPEPAQSPEGSRAS